MAYAMNPDARSPGIRNSAPFLGSPGINKPGGPPTAVASVNNWLPSFQVLYRLNEASGTRVNDGTLGTSLNLTVGGATTSTTNYVEDPRSAGFVAATNDFLTNATPTGLFYTDSFFVGCFAHRVSSAAMDLIQVANVGTKGWRAALDSSSRLNCAVGTGATVRTATVATAMPANVFRFLTCDYNGTTDTIVADMVGSATNSLASSVMVAADAGTPLLISRTGGSGITWQGYIDYCLITNKTLTAAQRCRLASCGVMGELGCECHAADVTQYASTGYNVSVAGSCTLPACDAAAP